MTFLTNYLNYLVLTLFLATPPANRWIQADGPKDLGIFCLSVYKDMLFVGTIGQGILKIDKKGVCRKPKSQGLPKNLFVRSLAGHDDALFAGTSLGVFISFNNGEDWKQRLNGLPVDYEASVYPNVYAISFFGANVYIGLQSQGVFYSNDNGNIWHALNSGLSTEPTILSFASIGKKLFAATTKGIYVLSEDGYSWKSTELNGSYTKVLADDNYLYAATYDFTINNGATLFLSSDQGNHWTAIDSSLRKRPRWFGINSMNKYHQLLFICSDGHGTFDSKDEGINWVSVNKGFPQELLFGDNYFNCLDFFNNQVYIGTSHWLWHKQIK